MTEARIDKFEGEYAFLSNFYPTTIKWEGETYPTLEHAFQAAKTYDSQERQSLRQAHSPGKAKQLGRQVTLRPDWEKVKTDIMRTLLLQKFQIPTLRTSLLATGNAQLIEGNNWHDKFWGACFCAKCGGGKNVLGKLLMEVRAILQRQEK